MEKIKKKQIKENKKYSEIIKKLSSKQSLTWENEGSKILFPRNKNYLSFEDKRILKYLLLLSPPIIYRRKVSHL